VKVVAFEGGGDDMDKPIKDTLLLSNSSNNKSNHLGRKQQHNGADDGGDEGNPVKEEGERERIFCGINSYNIGRPLMQMIHFIWIYLRMAEELGLQLGDVESPIDLVLPTGAMGNLTGGYMAKQMGIPIGKLCCGVNINGKRSIMSYNCHNEVVISCSLLNLLSTSSYSHIKIKTHRYYSQGNRSWRVSSSNDQKDIVGSH
jgi:hypothetical protein